MKKNRLLRVIFFLSFLIILSFSFSCRHETTGLTSIKDICFKTEILPIFQSNCAISGCHNSEKAAAELVLDNYEGIMTGITANDPVNSEIYQAITDPRFNTMPPSPRSILSLEQRTLIAVWIQQGAKNSTCN